MENFWNGVKCFSKDKVDSLRRYWHRKNAELRAKLKNEQDLQRVCNASNEYFAYTPVVADTVNNAAGILHLVPVHNPMQVHCWDWLHKYPNDVWTLRYRCHYHAGYGFTRSDFQRVLQQEMFQVCAWWQISRLVVSVKIVPHNSLHIEIVPYSTCLYWYNRKYRRKT